MCFWSVVSGPWAQFESYSSLLQFACFLVKLNWYFGYQIRARMIGILNRVQVLCDCPGVADNVNSAVSKWSLLVMMLLVNFMTFCFLKESNIMLGKEQGIDCDPLMVKFPLLLGEVMELRISVLQILIWSFNMMRLSAYPNAHAYECFSNSDWGDSAVRSWNSCACLLCKVLLSRSHRGLSL